jgi:hypothetical protein
MIMRMKIYAMAAATLLVSGSQAGAQPPGAPGYRTTFYNNAAHQTQVGVRMPWGCNYDEISGDSVNYRQFGSSSPYHDDELVGYCLEGAYNPV